MLVDVPVPTTPGGWTRQQQQQQLIGVVGARRLRQCVYISVAYTTPIAKLFRLHLMFTECMRDTLRQTHTSAQPNTHSHTHSHTHTGVRLASHARDARRCDKHIQQPQQGETCWCANITTTKNQTTTTARKKNIPRSFECDAIVSLSAAHIFRRATGRPRWGRLAGVLESDEHGIRDTRNTHTRARARSHMSIALLGDMQ